MLKTSLSVLSLALTLQVANAAVELSHCYPLSTTPKSELCIPSIGQGGKLLLSVSNALDGEALEKDFGTLSPLKTFESKAEKDLQTKNPNNSFFVMNSFFGKAGELFNKDVNFSGPNCYQTALLATGMWKENGNRYVSPEEFLFYLDNNYERVSSPEMGDIVVYEYTDSKGHAAVYLQDDLVFHKKSYMKGYGYRLANIDNVAKPESFEWTPRFDSGLGGALEGLNTKDRAYFRKKDSALNLGKVPAKDLDRVALIEEINKQVLILGPQWKVGTSLGFIMEQIVDMVISQSSYMQKSPVPALQLSYAKLISLRDQIFQSIEEVHFSSPYASERTRADICVEDTAAFRSILAKFLVANGKDASADSVQKVMTSLQGIDKSRCRLNLSDIIGRN